jgi:hypothetical protein
LTEEVPVRFYIIFEPFLTEEVPVRFHKIMSSLLDKSTYLYLVYSIY